MHIYIYDTYVNTKKFETEIAQIETRLTDLGLNGKIIRLGVMKSIQDIISNENENNINTIIAVGNDHTLNNLINSVFTLNQQSDYQNLAPIGFIPVGKKNNNIAPYLGIDLGVKACNALSARRINKYDIASANNNYFLAHAMIKGEGTQLEIDQNYSIEILSSSELGVINIPVGLKFPNSVQCSPIDGALELYINSKESNKILQLPTNSYSQSFFNFTKLVIKNTKHQLILDGVRYINPPVEISLVKNKLNLIIGKNRFT